jgi:hypothetical protein
MLNYKNTFFNWVITTIAKIQDIAITKLCVLRSIKDNEISLDNSG